MAAALPPLRPRLNGTGVDVIQQAESDGGF